MACALLILVLASYCCCNIFNYQQYTSTTRHKKNITLLTPIFIIDDKNEECSICLDIDNNQTWTILQCSHKFHNSCISTWLLNHQTCPIYRFHMNYI